MVIKVADFGLAVNTGAKEYYRLTNQTDIKLPLMWMAPESLSDYIFSEMSDVVSLTLEDRLQVGDNSLILFLKSGHFCHRALTIICMPVIMNFDAYMLVTNNAMLNLHDQCLKFLKQDSPWAQFFHQLSTMQYVTM